MRKTMLIIAASALLASAGTAFAAWQPLLIDSEAVNQYTAVTAGRSGNVKECYEESGTLNTYQWTHSQTGKTRGSYTEFVIGGSNQVDNSYCE